MNSASRTYMGDDSVSSVSNIRGKNLYGKTRLVRVEISYMDIYAEFYTAFIGGVDT